MSNASAISRGMSVRKAARRLDRLGVAVMAAVLLSACSERAPAAPVNLGLQSQGGWTLSSHAPVIRAGDMRKQGLWNDPSVLFEDGRYVMYFTTSVDKPFSPPILPFRAVSPDGANWRLEPETPLLSAKGTHFNSIETPSVVKFRGRYHMFFTGTFEHPNPSPMAIGHAVSDDGIHWSATPTPVLAATGQGADWNGYLVGEPGAVVFKDEILLYFSAVGARPGGHPPQSQTIGLARTVDGEHFSAPAKVLTQSSLYPPERGYAGYSTPAGFVLGGKVHLIYDVAHFQPGGDPEWEQVALHHAVSSDGGVTFLQDASPILSREDLPWTSGEILAPSALVEGDQVTLWFAGHVRRKDLGPMIRRGIAGPEFGIGTARKSVSAFQ
jgi:hypothetical protein